MPERRGAAPQGPVDVPLVCGHRMRVRPSQRPVPGVLLWCGLCGDYTHSPFPLEANKHGERVLGEWRWKCLTNRRCNSGQHGHGNSETNAMYAATRHSHKYPTHEVWLISPRGVVAKRWGPDSWGAPEPLWKNGVATWKEEK